jgi:uncharacterized YccA/Bax inhibitor family protein
MNIGRTANPALNKNTFSSRSFTYSGTDVMTLEGTVNKTGILLLLVMGGAAYTWRLFMKAADPDVAFAAVSSWMLIGGIGGFISALVTIFRKTAAPYSAPIYALLEGLFLGGISAFFETQYPGIVKISVALTFGTLFSLLFAYKTGWIKATQNFKLGVFAATGGIALVYLVTFILGFFGISVGFMQSNSLLSIGISVFIVVIAALNLVLDFDFIEQGAKAGAPKYMEWYGAFGLIVTLIWLYIEILRLLSKIASRR